MFSLKRLGHYGLKVKDMGRAVDFYTGVLGLELTDRTQEGLVYLRTGEDHHALVLYPLSYRDPFDPGLPAGPGLHHVAFEVGEEVDLSAIARHLKDQGIPLVAGPAEAPGPGRHRFLRFLGPDGHRMEVFQGMERAERPPPPSRVRPKKLGHLALKVRDPAKTEGFLTEVLPFKLSDWIGDLAVFVRCNPDHHCLVCFRSENPGLHHSSWEVASWEEFKHMADHLMEHGRPLYWGPGRHGPGNNLFTYFRDAEGNIIEIYAELQLITPESPYEPRVWDLNQNAVDRWGSRLPADFLL